jgi:uncharacterized protein YyaL (SSP411 family)
VVDTLRHVPPNHLAAASSPYLLQHAGNPVDWHEWGAEALELAAALDRPLFISIGYASCHWCHVMAHETFEDPRIAELLNASFVSIKIDREERPDLDQLYMSATQAATGHGGWPMTVFATPDGRPFFAGTYFPPADRGGQPSFERVVAALEEAWRTRRGEVEAQADELSRAVATEARFVDSLAEELVVGELAFDDVLAALVGSLGERFDPEHGGFGGAPKFPRPSYVEALLVHHVRTGDPGSLAMATLTLDAMAAGGIYDHLAGGFARYSVDARWRVPHFEKMLTDQALLVRCYLHAWQLTGRDDYAQVVTETLDWLLDELALKDGGLASSIDADAAGAEGSHAVFRPDEVAAALEGSPGALRAEEACAFYLVTPEGSFEEGSSVLARPLGQPLRRSERAEEARRALLEARRARPAPAIDDKVLVEWNAMAAAALAEAAAAMGVERWGRAATELVELLDGTFHDAGGRLLRAGRGAGRRHLAMLGDHAWLLEALTRLFELDGDDRWLERAHRVARSMLVLFWDGELPSSLEPQRGGGFFTTGHDAEQLLARSKELFDGALPSATATAVTSLIRLGRLTGSSDLLAVAERSIELVSSILERHPLAVPDLVLALGWQDEGLEVVIPGDDGPLLAAVRGAYAPFAVTAHGHGARCILLEQRTEGLAYLCRHRVCKRPTDDAELLLAQLAAAVQG